LFAIVSKPWPWSCVVSGDLAAYADVPIAMAITTKMREEYPSRSVTGLGLKRIIPMSTTFDETYYRDLTGNSRLPNDRFAEILGPSDPRAPMEPIEGVEASLDGSFWMRIDLYEVTYFDPATKQISVKRIATGRVNGKLTCPQCAM
jgi:hypothetical protein